MTARGRPPDPDLETRVHAAALELYGEVGWAGFSFDVLARRAHVGKATLYGKWGSKERLIVAALATGLPPHPEEKTAGSLRDNLIQMAGEILDSYLEPQGLVYLRAQIEARVYPELFGQALESFQRERIRIGRAVVVAAIDRGELPAGTSPALVLDAVAGILTSRFLSTPIGQTSALAARKGALVEEIVDFVLSAVHHRESGS
ncbi:TetR/AcrR family transcriptional regulator [Nonomuraea sp. NPDC048826]|uniref:TetR/AcrR family transcriptional regulator n=1 Tax=Nonomuraea sp. NPDC048826 TaxID=3364347 RepID=UPI0037171144